jgi:tetratricopeptide (TPR) repeat protein
MVNQIIFGRLLPRLHRALGICCVAAAFCLIFVMCQRAISDPDIWLHLKTGELILKNKAVPVRDIFSCTVAGKPWVDHEWLFQVITYLVYSRWGADGLISLESYVILLTFLVLLLIAGKSIRSNTVIAVFLSMVAYVCLPRFNIRPDVFSMFFFALTLYILYYYAAKKIIWLLVFIQALWVNFHGYFFLGPLTLFFFMLAEFLGNKRKPLPGQLSQKFSLDESSYTRMKRVFIAMILACLVNPRGLTGALYPLEVIKGISQGRAWIFFKNIQELQATFSVTGLGSIYFLLLFLCFAVIVINFRRLKLQEIFLAAFFFLFAFTARNVAFSIIVGFTIIVSYFDETIRKVFINIRPIIPTKQVVFFLLKYSVALIFIIWVVLRIDKLTSAGFYDFETNKFVSLISGINQKHYPAGAADFLLENNIEASIFNDFNSGSYLIGKGYPEIKVFIDGRTELYGPDFFEFYQSIMKGGAREFEEATERYKISLVVLSLDSNPLPGIINYLYNSSRWKMVFFDDTGLVFLKDTLSHKELINRFGIDLALYHSTKANLQKIGLRKVYPLAYIKRASLFYFLKQDGLVVRELKEALRIMPNCAQAYYLLGKVYLRGNRYQEALENLRLTLLFDPGNVQAFIDLGNCLKELKDDKSSLYAFKGAIGFSRHYALAYSVMGSVFSIMHKESWAIQALGVAIKYDPLNPLYHFKLAEALYKEGKKIKDFSGIIKARNELDKAFKLNVHNDPDLTRKIKFLLQLIEVCDIN